MSNKEDLKNKKYGKWEVISNRFRKNNKSYFTCKCECGTVKDVERNSLISGRSTQCKKCSSKALEKDDKYIGKIFGEIEVIKVDKDFFDKNKRKKYICKCSCGYEFSSFSHNFTVLTKCKKCKEKDGSILGKTYERLIVVEEFKEGKIMKCKCLCKCGNETTVRKSDLVCNKTKSCGCLSKEVKLKINKTHGMTRTRLHNIWTAMKQRCYYPNHISFNSYGGRGIIVCDEWKNDFMSFYNWAMENGYEDGLSIDRIDVNGNYEPNNCRWANNYIQSNNKTNNRYIKYNGEVKTLREWSDILGINYNTLRTQTKKYTLEQIMEGK